MVDCDGTENFTTASHRGCRKKGGGRLGGGKFLASSMCVPTYCRAMHTAMHTDVIVEGGVLIVGRCLYSLKEHSINAAPNSHLRSCGYHRSLPIASSTIAPLNDREILSVAVSLSRRELSMTNDRRLHTAEYP